VKGVEEEAVVVAPFATDVTRPAILPASVPTMMSGRSAGVTAADAVVVEAAAVAAVSAIDATALVTLLVNVQRLMAAAAVVAADGRTAVEVVAVEEAIMEAEPNATNATGLDI